MRTNIDINDDLLRTMMEVSGSKTKKAAVELALQAYIDMMRRTDLASIFGQVKWDGDLNQLRTETSLNEWDQ